MRVVGVIAEYNPLHNGHIYHLEQAKRKTGASYCIVIMSGNFVQRGSPPARTSSPGPNGPCRRERIW